MSSILTVCIPQPDTGPTDDELYLDFCDFQIASELALRLGTRETDGGT